MGRRIILCGTGTEVGKTHVGVALTAFLAERGEDVVALKPVETGVSSEPTDAQRLGAAGVFHVKQARYAFEPPISPHLAAREQGTSIDLAEIRDWVEHHAAPWQIIETAGGLLSPLAAELTNAHLVCALAPAEVVMVGADRLGALHDVSAALLALRTLAPQCAPSHVALSEPHQPDRSTGTNAQELVRLGVVPRAHHFPRRPVSHEDTRRAARGLMAALEGVG